jgi:tRNA dimethylallyltransferase
LIAAPRTDAYLVIAGPTAVGKSAVAMAVAERIGGEIVIGDSRQVYRGLDIGTAKPSLAEQERVPHHLLNLVEPGERFSAGAYATLARAAIAEIRGRGRVPVVCGGTGFYLAALAGALEPLNAEPSSEAREHARRELEPIPPEERLARLAEIDPDRAAELHANDRQRIDRALGYVLATGRRFSESAFSGQATGADVGFALTRSPTELAERIDVRCRAMIDGGLETEARTLYERGLGPGDPGVDSIGYQEWWPYFEGRASAADVLDAITVATRRYAKRQRTWFRNQGAYRPVPADEAVEVVIRAWSAMEVPA